MKKKFLKIWLVFVNLRFDFIFFDRRKLFIYDWTTGKYYKNFFDHKKTYYHHCRFSDADSKINFYILVWSILNLFFYKNLRISHIYTLNMIKIYRPKTIITFTDYDYFFYEIKNFFPKIKIISFQHQVRNKTFLQNKIFIKENKKFNIDYCCVFGKNLKNYYSLFLETNFKIIGSLRNNLYKKIDKTAKNKNLVLISSFRPGLYKKYFKEKKLKFFNQSIKFMHEYCKLKKIKLTILSWSASQENTTQKKYSLLEKNYYNRLLGKESYEFLQKKKFNDSYIISRKFKYFISFSSTLGYELFSRDFRVAILRSPIKVKDKNLIKKNLNFKDSISSFKLRGIFWSNIYSKKEIFRILNNIYKLKIIKINSLKRKYIDPFMTHDYKSQKNLYFLKSIGFKFISKND